MSSQDFMKMLEGTDYSFLRENSHLANKIMLLGLSGSYGYSTNREDSDVDFRKVVMQQPSDPWTDSVRAVFGYRHRHC